jgi:hypothetical protein
VFVTAPQNVIWALDAATAMSSGLQEELARGPLQLHPTNRGVALYEDKVYSRHP